MQYSITKFKLSDLDEMDPREESVSDWQQLKKEKIYQEIYLKGMPFFTLRADGEVILIYGFMYAGCDTFVPSALFSKTASKHTKRILKSFYEYYGTYIPKSVRRLEVCCDIMDVKAIRFAQHFGFDIVGIRHGATPEGHDQALMERLMYYDVRKVEK